MLPFHNVVKSDFEAVNQLIVEQLESDVGLVENIGHYIVDSGGKRLRPLVVLLSALACNPDTIKEQRHIRLACVIEFIHTATLLHDDVVDMSQLRRGRLTANAKWGNSPTVLVGDFLYSRAFQMLVELGDISVMRLLADTTNIIAEGEVQQLVSARDTNLSEKNYLEVLRKKTAVLFQAASQGGAMIAGENGANEPTALISELARYGLHLGMAFQLQDDALDYTGSSEQMGKNIGDDLAEGKPTMPLIYTIKHGSSAAKDLVQNALENGDVREIHNVTAAVCETGGLEYTRQLALAESQKATESLQNLPQSTYKDALIQLADFSVNRSY